MYQPVTRPPAKKHLTLPNRHGRLALPFIDLTPGLRAVPASKAASFFFPEGQPAEGHYTEAGNAWVAEQLYRRLRDYPPVNALLAGTGESPVTVRQ